MTNKHNLSPKQIQHLKNGVQALRENKIKAKGRMRDLETGGRCCLCVLLDQANKDGANLKENYSYPKDEIAPWYGFRSKDPHINNFALSHHNDGAGTPEKTHAEIADMIGEEFLK